MISSFDQARADALYEYLLQSKKRFVCLDCEFFKETTDLYGVETKKVDELLQYLLDEGLISIEQVDQYVFAVIKEIEEKPYLGELYPYKCGYCTRTPKRKELGVPVQVGLPYPYQGGEKMARKNTNVIEVYVSREERTAITEAARAAGMSASAFCLKAVKPVLAAALAAAKEVELVKLFDLGDMSGDELLKQNPPLPNSAELVAKAYAELNEDLAKIATLDERQRAELLRRQMRLAAVISTQQLQSNRANIPSML